MAERSSPERCPGRNSRRVRGDSSVSPGLKVREVTRLLQPRENCPAPGAHTGDRDGQFVEEHFSG